MASKKKNEVSVEFTANLSKFKKNINEATSDISEMASALRLNQTQMKEQGESVELLEKRQQILTDTIEAYNKKLEAQQGQLKLITEAYGADSIEAEKLRTQINNTTNSLTKMTAELSASEQKLKQAASGIDELHTATRSADNMISELSAALRLNEEQMRTMGETSELVAQRQDLLEQSAKAYEDKLEALNKELEAAVELYGESSTEASKLRTQINNTATAANKLEPSIEGVNDELEDTDKAAKDAGDELGVMDVAAGNLVANGLTALASGLKNAATEFIGLAEETREYRTEQAKLDTAFQTAGWSADTAKNTYMELYAVLGEEDRSVEAANHLAQLANTQEDLTDWTKICAGVFATFGDSLPIEGLTEAANETAKVGDVTGVLADALNWAGVNEEDFQAALDECSTEQERAAKITETLNGLYSDAADAFYESNESVIEANRVNAEYTDTLADLGEMVEPLSTTFKKGFGNILKSVDNPQMESAIDNLNDSFEDMFNDLSDIAEEAGPAFVEVVGFAARNIKDLAIVIPTAVIAFKSLKSILDAAKVSGTGFWAALSAHPLTAIAGGISAFIGVLELLQVAYNETSETAQNLAEAERVAADNQEFIDSVDAKINAMDDYRKSLRDTADNALVELDYTQKLADELFNLADANGNVSEAEQSRAQYIIDTLNEQLGTQLELTNGQIQGNQDLKQSINDLIEAQRIQAELTMLSDQATESRQYVEDLKTDLAVAQQLYEDAGKELETYRQKLDEATHNFDAAISAGGNGLYWKNQIEDLQDTVDIYEASYAELGEQVNQINIEISNSMRDVVANDEAHIAAIEGNTDRVHDIANDRVAIATEMDEGLEQSQIERKAQLEQEIIITQNTLDELRRRFEAGDKTVTEERIAAKEQELAALSQLYAEEGYKDPEVYAEALNAAKGTAVNAAGGMASDINLHMDTMSMHSRLSGKAVPTEFAGGVEETKDIAVGASTQLDTDIKYAISDVGMYAKGQGNDYSTKFGEGVNESKDGAVTAAIGLDTDVKSAISGLGKFSGAEGESIPEEMKGGIKKFLKDALGEASSLSGGILQKLRAANLGYESTLIGNAISDGMRAGINAKANSVATAAASVASGAIWAAKRAIQSNSPSKLAEHEVGEPIPQGVAVGIEEDAHLAEEAAEEQAQSVIAAYSKGMKNLDPYVFRGMKAVLPPETFTGMKAKLPELPQISGALETAVNAKLADDRLVQAIEALANRPVYLDVNGRRFAVLTAHDTDMVNGTRQILRDRGLSI